MESKACSASIKAATPPLACNCLMMLKVSKLAPRGLFDNVMRKLEARDFGEAKSICRKENNTIISKIVLAGLPGIVVRPLGWKFLNRLYGIPGFRHNFDIAAFQPYSPDPVVATLVDQMTKYRKVMKRHGDKRKQLWATEFGYGSAPHTGTHVNYGLTGQASRLRRTYKVFLKNRHLWRLHGVVWYDWRDPSSPNKDCSFCSTAG